MITNRFFLLLTVNILIGSFSFLNAQNTVTVIPQEYPDALSNPFKGFRPDPRKTFTDDYPTIVREYIKWNEVENDEGDGADKIIAHCNKLWAGFENKNIKVAAQIYIDWDDKQGNENWPQDIVDKLGYPTSDVRYWTSDLVKKRIEKLIYKLGEAWDNDPRVAWVNTAILGYWGEQENPVGADEEGYAVLMGNAFEKAFKNKKLLVRNQKYWDNEGFNWGVGWGSFAHPGQTSGSWADIRRTTSEGQYLTQIVEGEVAYNWGHDVFVPVMGSSPTITLGTDKYTNYLIDVIKELHCTGLGWVSGYKLDGSEGTNPAVVKSNASKMQKAFGYRFVLPEFTCSRQVARGDSLTINFKVQNTGSAPFYYNWQTAFVLIDETTHEIVWKEALPGVDCRNWEPGKNYNYSTHQYNVAAPVYEISASLAVPDSINTGQYMAGITILEPFSGTPGVFFAVENFLKKSQSQPLCRIGIGENLTGSHEINPLLFDDPLKDDARYYTLTPQGKTYKITGDTPNGSLQFRPAGNNYVPGTVVTVTAVGNLGYGFEQWGGDHSNKVNSITIVMDGDKTVSASFKEVPTVTLATSSEYGSIVLNPPGGEYNVGTVVKLTPKANLGYLFEKWGGDIDGSSSPETITMDANKTVSARFVYGGAGKANYAVNCGGSAYQSVDGTSYIKDMSGGSSYTSNSAISGTEDDQLYKTERYGNNFSYKIPVSNGSYMVTLMFAELYHSSAGNRVFNVSIEGKEVISNLDIYAKVGKNAAYNETHEVIISDGEINIAFTTNKDNAKISAIKIASKAFEGETFTLSKTASNGTIEAIPAEGPYPAGSNVQLRAIPDPGLMFSAWSGDLAGSENPAILYMNGNKNVTASFEPIPSYTITSEATNGTISFTPQSVSYLKGTSVTVKATPDPGYVFAGWSGGLSGTNNPQTIVVDADKNIKATFNPLPIYTIKTLTANGSVSLNPSGGSYIGGTSVALTAIPDTGYEFVGWIGDISSTTNPLTIVVIENKNINAVFVKITGIDELQNGLPNTALGQNYPNPFSVKTTIPFRLSEPTNVKISIFNSIGQEIVQLIDKQLPAGYHTIDWYAKDMDGHQLSGGIYLCRMVTGNQIIQTKKLIVTR